VNIRIRILRLVSLCLLLLTRIHGYKVIIELWNAKILNFTNLSSNVSLTESLCPLFDTFQNGARSGSLGLPRVKSIYSFGAFHLTAPLYLLVTVSVSPVVVSKIRLAQEGDSQLSRIYFIVPWQSSQSIPHLALSWSDIMDWHPPWFSLYLCVIWIYCLGFERSPSCHPTLDVELVNRRNNKRATTAQCYSISCDSSVHCFDSQHVPVRALELEVRTPPSKVRRRLWRRVSRSGSTATGTISSCGEFWQVDGYAYLSNDWAR